MVQSTISSQNFSYLCITNSIMIMIVTNHTQISSQKTKATSTRKKVMANTMSVDEYFDELIDQVREDYANL